MYNEYSQLNRVPKRDVPLFPKSSWGLLVLCVVNGLFLSTDGRSSSPSPRGSGDEGESRARKASATGISESGSGLVVGVGELWNTKYDYGSFSTNHTTKPGDVVVGRRLDLNVNSPSPAAVPFPVKSRPRLSNLDPLQQNEEEHVLLSIDRHYSSKSLPNMSQGIGAPLPVTSTSHNAPLTILSSLPSKLVTVPRLSFLQSSPRLSPPEPTGKSVSGNNFLRWVLP